MDLTPGNASRWNKVWNAGGYEPDPILKLAYGVGAMSYYNGYLYWGTLNPPLSSVNLLFQTYGKPTDPQTIVTDGLRANRTAVLLRAQNFSAAAPSINLLYGESSLPVFTAATPTTPGDWNLGPNNVPSGTCTSACGTRPLFGQSGFGNIWTDYMWSMAVINSRLYIGTMNWEFVAYGYTLAGVATLPPSLTLQPAKFGDGLFYFADSTHSITPVSTNGLRRFLNYGVRNIIPYQSLSRFYRYRQSHESSDFG